MPFKESCAMDERMRFIGYVLSGEASMTELCEAFSISRKTGYKWVARYEEFGPAGLEERPSVPRMSRRRRSSRRSSAFVCFIRPGGRARSSAGSPIFAPTSRGRRPRRRARF
jgi:putative transposase